VGLAIDIIPEKGGQCSFYCGFPLKSRFLLYFGTKKQVVFDTTITSLEERTCMSSENMVETELFWNQIMMEHALFIRGLLDPTECELVETADTYAGDYCRLLEEARQ